MKRSSERWQTHLCV